jgi:FtsH-binding integral membrane protein
VTVSHNQLEMKQRTRHCTTSVLWLMLAQLFVTGLMCAYGYSSHGSACITAATLAAVVCFVPAVAALVVVAMTAGTPNSLSGTLLSVGVRSAAPLFAVIFLPQLSEPLADAGVLGMVLVNYLVVLAVESLLAVRMVQTLGTVAVRQ